MTILSLSSTTRSTRSWSEPSRCAMSGGATTCCAPRPTRRSTRWMPTSACPKTKRPPLWPLLLFSKCLHHTVNAEASGLRERSEGEWLGVLNAAGAVPELDLARLVVASQRLFGFTAQASADDDDADVVDHADETEERLGQLPS